MDLIENEFVKFWHKDGLMYSAFKGPVHLGPENAKRFIDLRHIISNDQYQYWVMDLRNLKSASKETHDYIGNNGNELLHASAIIVNTFLVKFIVEVYIRVKKPKIPVKIFNSKVNAVDWLMEIKDKQKNIVVNV
jgi:hypothetical protein